MEKFGKFVCLDTFGLEGKDEPISIEKGEVVLLPLAMAQELMNAGSIGEI